MTPLIRPIKQSKLNCKKKKPTSRRFFPLQVTPIKHLPCWKSNCKKTQKSRLFLRCTYNDTNDEMVNYEVLLLSYHMIWQEICPMFVFSESQPWGGNVVLTGKTVSFSYFHLNLDRQYMWNEILYNILLIFRLPIGYNILLY